MKNNEMLLNKTEKILQDETLNFIDDTIFNNDDVFEDIFKNSDSLDNIFKSDDFLDDIFKNESIFDECLDNKNYKDILK